MNFIGIDVGTSGTKVVLTDEYGYVKKTCSSEYPLYQPYNGWAQQDRAIGGTRQ